ncbi:MAG: energy-coupling factor transporter transmembrane component T family protein [Dethiobacteria bacterium]|jgi:energy-coupling factor transport system permease protein|nr:energy-coupling factor transporter transmembrane protein EcfT [Bacillota bacterium]
MSRSITFGHYIPGDSFLHQLDPRIKLIILILSIAALFLVEHLIGFIIIGGFLFFFLITSGTPLRYFLRGVRPILLIILFTVVLHIFFTKGGEVLFRLGPVTIESDGVYLASFMAIRLILLVLMTTLITLTTSPLALTDGVEYLLRPFRRLGVPAHDMAMMMTIALRFIPTLMEESEKIMKAQMARGADFSSGNIIRKAKSLVPILVPLFVSAFRRADELAVAMEARCYRGGENRTRMRELHVRWVDVVSLFVVLMLMCLLIYVRIS